MCKFSLMSNTRHLFSCAAASMLVLLVAAAYAKPPAGTPQSDTQAIKDLISNYAAALNAEPINMKLLSQVWLDSPDDSFIHPLGHEHGWGQIKQNLYEKIMEGYFSERQLTIRDINIHVYGDSAWAEFYWHFVAKSRNGGSAVETNGRETQVYRKLDQGRWALVHVHYSGMPAAPQPNPSPAK
jgi:ketosteroid isomerase-like protein